MKYIEFYKKISWLISVSLGLFYLGGGYFVYKNNFEVASKSFLFGIFWLVLAYFLKKTIKKDVDFFKILEFCAYVFSYSKTEQEISQKRLEYILFLMNKKSKIFQELVFDNLEKVPEKITKLCQRSPKMFSKSRSLKANPWALCPEHFLSESEKETLNQILEETDNLSDSQIYIKTNE